jgi:methylmalonyl-CoA mutase N-terminal domain/subunit
MIAHESGVTNTVDPLGGSYFVEALTDTMEQRAYEYFAKIDELGGMVEAVKQGFPQREIADAAFELQQEIDGKERIVVGVNEYVERQSEPLEILHVDPALERKQIDRLRTVRERRDGDTVQRTLDQLKEDAATPERNLMPTLLECARADASEGEIIAALQDVFGSYREAPIF